MTNGAFKRKKIILLLLLCILQFGCWCKKALVIVPVRESEFRAEYFLPLDDSKTEAIVEFIADGGVHKEDGFNAGLEQDSFRKFLMFFREEANLTVGTFQALPGIKEFIDPAKPIYDVIDAREEKGAYQNNRLAYRFRDFWFILMIDKLKNEEGQFIKDNEKMFSRIIVIRVLEQTEKEK